MENNYDNFKEEHFLPGNNRKNSFVLPKDYFNSLSLRILNRIEHEQELAEFRTLSENRKPGFKTPENYFASLANRLECKYELSDFPELSKTGKPVLKPLPAGYFKSTDQKLADKLELESELKEFTVLSSIPKKNSFKVAPAYFDNTVQTVNLKSNQPRIAPFRQLTAILFRPQMAIAASLVLIVGISAIWYFNREDGGKRSGDCLTLACLEKNEILNETNIQDFDDESLYEMVDEAALDEHLSKGGTAVDSINTRKNQ